jgi:3-phenylpropionate/trans-cinnamate dioxygenase ferredoxin component
MDTNFIKVAEKSEIPAGKVKAIKIEETDILLANVNGSFYAISLKCTHMGGDLSKGQLDGNTITCPKHHAQFDVTTGKVVSHPKMGLFHPKAKDAKRYEVKVESENIMIKP